MFFNVDAKDLVVGTKYVIAVYHDKYYTARFGYHTSGPGQHFYDAKQYSRIKNIYMHNIIQNVYNKNRDACIVFVPQKEKIQQAMEQRALDKILKRIVNDDFTW
jgi:hypothetical protein